MPELHIAEIGEAAGHRAGERFARAAIYSAFSQQAQADGGHDLLLLVLSLPATNNTGPGPDAV